MKILELTNYSAGICGVWQRVKQESSLLSKRGNEVLVMSSNLEKGTSNLVKKNERINGFQIKRFKARKMGGESFMHWLSESVIKEVLDFKPDIIIAHSYRHLHTLMSLKIAKKTNSKVFLVTHAPFRRDRGMLNNLIVKTYDLTIGRSMLNKFDKIITITNWEEPYLENLGIRREKIMHIPNGIPDLFFTQKPKKEKNEILFFGRVSPIKNLETLIKAMPLIKDNKITLKIVGPKEKEYLKKLNNLIKRLNLGEKTIFSKPIYNIKNKIEKIDSSKIFVLPSISEGMSQSLIEAMARKKVVIASDNLGNKDLIKDNKNGYLFKTKDEKDLSNKINMALSKDSSQIKTNAKRYVEKFKWSKVIKDLENSFR